MPYANIEKQRTYQRNWARWKASEKPIDLRKNFITWEQLQEVDEITNLKTWEECTSRTRTLLSNKKTNRYLIACLALKACVIKWGGKHKTSDITLADFAKDVGINRKTLWTWVTIKTDIADRLPNLRKGLDWTAANEALRNAYTTNEDPIAFYHRYFENPAQKATSHTVRHLGAARHVFEKYGLKSFTREELNKMRKDLKIIVKILSRPA